MDQRISLHDRRLVTLELLAQLLDADCGHWSWGRGNPKTSTIVPLAMIDFGYTDAQRSIMIEHALKKESMETFQKRVMSQLGDRAHIAVVRRDVLPDTEWHSSSNWTEYVERIGLDSWLHAVWYQSLDTWSCIHLTRNTGKAEFTAAEAELTENVLVKTSWMHASASEIVPEEVFKPLTPRQRSVMLLLLDGLSRKRIATSLEISEETVDSLLKSIFKHFGVQSALELAAIFLKNR